MNHYSEWQKIYSSYWSQFMLNDNNTNRWKDVISRFETGLTNNNISGNFNLEYVTWKYD